MLLKEVRSGHRLRLGRRPRVGAALRGGGRQGRVADVDLDWAKETVRLIEADGGTAVADRCDVVEEADVEATIALAVAHVRSPRHHVQQRRRRRPRGPGLIFEDHTVDDFDRLFAINAKGVFLGSKHAMMQFKRQGDGGVIVNTGSVAGLVVGWQRVRLDQGRGEPDHQGRGHRVRAVRDPRATRSARRGCRSPTSPTPMGLEVREDQARRWRRRGHDAPARSAHHRRGLRRGRGVPGVRPRQEHHRRAPAGRRRVRRPMSGEARSRAASLDPRARAARGCSTCAAATTRSPVAATPTTRIRCGTACASRPRARGHRPRAHRLPG